MQWGTRVVPVDRATIHSPHKSLLSFALLSLHISSAERQLSFFLGAFAWLRSSLRPESASKLPIRLVRALARATFAERTNTPLPLPPKAFPESPHIRFSHAYYLGGFVVTVSCHWLYGPTPAFAMVNTTISLVGEGAGGTVGRGLVRGEHDPDVEPELVTTVDHVIWANRVDPREIDPVFYAYVFSFFWI